MDIFDKNEIMLNQELAEDLHKPIITKLEKRKVLKEKLGANLAEIQLISKYNKWLTFFVCY